MARSGSMANAMLAIAKPIADNQPRFLAKSTIASGSRIRLG
jgi:hypothetical protein